VVEPLPTYANVSARATILSTMQFSKSFSVTALLVGAMCAHAQNPFGAQQSLKAVAGRADLSAVWQSPQQGYVIDLRARSPRIFHITPDACWPDSELAENYVDHVAVGRFNKDKSQLKIAPAVGASETLWVRLDALPVRCNEKPKITPTAVLRAWVQTMSEHYAFFKERNVDWPTLSAAASQRITDASSETELFEEIAKLLSSLNDPHTTLQAKIDGHERRSNSGRGATLTALRKAYDAQNKAKNPAAFLRDWFAASQAAVNKQLLGGGGKAALKGTAFWGLSTDRVGSVGYLSLTLLKDLTRSETIADDIEAVDALLDEVIAACSAGAAGLAGKDCNAIILDLSQNRGGDDRVALAVAARFAQAGGVAYTKQAWSKSASADVQAIALTPSTKPRWLGEVILVTDSVTVSAAEVLTLAMRTLPKVVHVGQTTRGAFSDALEKSLPNGWRFSLSNEVYNSAGGEVLEARGIAPIEAAAVFDTNDFFSAQAKFLTALAARARVK
jgi:carboxyl-terminal processing protease